MLKSKIQFALLIGLLSATTSEAGSLACYLDQSDRLADGVNYLLVTTSDDGQGSIDFRVAALQRLIDFAGDNSGIRMFGFSVVGGTGAGARNVSSLPDKWRAQNGRRS
ncbi:MAG: hypothetical protein OEW88_00400 [Gammaproteobacteria bacterium]|nr:hypothetical protein [Gammaproteobacteria bacterium]MDH5274866.1 hypothetical protein [Gammaproteobacteria bacterium]